MEIKHSFYMQRCLELAQNGLGRTYPNPFVGSVVVHKDIIIGEGWHQKAGTPHAEVHAIESVKNKELLKNSTLYVNLEPCNHFGKTPPCTELIIAMGIPKVVIGCMDKHSKVAGMGIKRLREAGVAVEVGVLEEQCLSLNKRFFTFHIQKRPYVVLKWAQSVEGFIAPLYKEKLAPVWLSCQETLQKVHKWRSEEEAILVGKNTAVLDNPSLTTRHFSGKNPLRVLVDKNGVVSSNYEIFNNEAPTVVFTQKAKNLPLGVKAIEIDFSSSLPEQICNGLFALGVQSVMVEGGGVTLQQFIASNLWDEARLLSSQVCLGSGIKAPQLPTVPFKAEKSGTDTIFFFNNTKGV